MAKSIKFDTSKFEQGIRRYQKDTQEKLKKAIIQIALVDVETVAKQILTAGGHVDTGRLRASIHTSYWGNTGHSYGASSVGAKTGRRAKQTSFDGGLSVKPSHELEVYVGSNVVYARRRHYETTPFLQSALESARAKFVSTIKKAL
jgi:hypothetical protein